jgi:uncharacterized protein (DUF362 family)
LCALSAAPLCKVNSKVWAFSLRNEDENISKSEKRLGVGSDGYSEIFIVKNGSPEKNMKHIIEMMGGIKEILNKEDIVVIKPNSQWWNQGMTNTNSMKEFIRLVLDMPGFKGEIIIADNHQYQDDNSRGWTTKTPNGDFNLNQLVDYFHKNGYRNVSKYHFHCAGLNKSLLQGNAYGDYVRQGPGQGDGYIWCKDLIYKATSGRKVMMSYPIFTSKYSGITIDLKNGAWGNGRYLDRKVKLINFPSLNYHSTWAGVTCSIKNYLGLVDMSCGYHGDSPKGFYNFHYVGNHNFKIHSYVDRIRKFIRLGYFDHFHGGPVGYFMKHIKMADLNIVTAHWVGYGSRTDINLSAKPKVVLASKDPVALDYFASKYVLLPNTPKDTSDESGNNFRHFNDPDKNGPLRWYLEECHKEGIGNLEESKMRILRLDLSA